MSNVKEKSIENENLEFMNITENDPADLVLNKSKLVANKISKKDKESLDVLADKITNSFSKNFNKILKPTNNNPENNSNNDQLIDIAIFAFNMKEIEKLLPDNTIVKLSNGVELKNISKKQKAIGNLNGLLSLEEPPQITDFITMIDKYYSYNLSREKYINYLSKKVLKNILDYPKTYPLFKKKAFKDLIYTTFYANKIKNIVGFKHEIKPEEVKDILRALNKTGNIKYLNWFAGMVKLQFRIIPKYGPSITDYFKTKIFERNSENHFEEILARFNRKANPNNLRDAYKVLKQTYPFYIVTLSKEDIHKVLLSFLKEEEAAILKASLLYRKNLNFIYFVQSYEDNLHRYDLKFKYNTLNPKIYNELNEMINVFLDEIFYISYTKAQRQLQQGGVACKLARIFKNKKNKNFSDAMDIWLVTKEDQFMYSPEHTKSISRIYHRNSELFAIFEFFHLFKLQNPAMLLTAYGHTSVHGALMLSLAYKANAGTGIKTKTTLLNPWWHFSPILDALKNGTRKYLDLNDLELSNIEKSLILDYLTDTMKDTTKCFNGLSYDKRAQLYGAVASPLSSETLTGVLDPEGYWRVDNTSQLLSIGAAEANPLLAASVEGSVATIQNASKDFNCLSFAKTTTYENTTTIRRFVNFNVRNVDNITIQLESDKDTIGISFFTKANAPPVDEMPDIQGNSLSELMDYFKTIGTLTAIPHNFLNR